MGEEDGFVGINRREFEELAVRTITIQAELDKESARTEKLVPLMGETYKLSASLLNKQLVSLASSIDAVLVAASDQSLYGYALTIGWFLDTVETGIEGLKALNGSRSANSFDSF